MRLTNKNGDNYIFAWQFDKNLKPLSKKRIFQNIANKLGQIEDVEEEHGEFLIAIKALIQGKIFVKGSKRIYKKTVQSLKYRNFWALFIKSNHYVAVSDYKKTWALTREELLGKDPIMKIGDGTNGTKYLQNYVVEKLIQKMVDSGYLRLVYGEIVAIGYGNTGVGYPLNEEETKFLCDYFNILR